MRLLVAATQAKIAKLVLWSQTLLFGASPSNPNFLTEDAPLRGTAVIVITPTGEAEWLPELVRLAQRGVDCDVVLLDRPSFGGEEGSA